MSSSTKKILLVEDNTYVSRMYERAFRLHGYTIDVVSDGEKALAFLSVTNPPPAVIVLDVAMPHMNGFELLKRIREQKKFDAVPAIILTNSFSEEASDRFLSAGADAFFIKINITAKELVEKVESWITQGRSTHSSP